jgi:hypothetical protein
MELGQAHLDPLDLIARGASSILSIAWSPTNSFNDHVDVANGSLLLSISGHHLPPFPTENSQMETNIRSLVEGFVNQIVASIEADSVRRVQQAVTAAFAGGAAPGRSGRPARALAASALAAAAPVKRRPRQFCPVPGCTGIAAPVFGMVCAKHKNVAKSKIKEFRAQRKAAKSGKK